MPAHGLDSGWTEIGFHSSSVSLIKSNPNSPDQMAAVVDNNLKISIDGGILWRDSYLPATPSQLVYDTVYPDRIYAGTSQGLYVSQNMGLSWSAFGDTRTGTLITLGLSVNRDYVFADGYNGAGTAIELRRFNRDGSYTLLTTPERDVGPLSVDALNDSLYTASAGAIYRSNNNGASWQAVAGVPNIGFRTLRIVAKGADLWQLSTDGPFYSSDAGVTWKRMVTASGNADGLIEQYYNDRQYAGLVINHGNVFFGASSSDGRVKDSIERTAGGVIRLGLGMKVLDEDGGNRLFAATSTGLWARSGLVSTEASIKRPVVVVPGILGSWQVKGKWVLDPIMHTYDPLMNQLESVGYVEDKTVFGFGYQWRQDNDISARELSAKINEIKGICHCNKVDVIGHSMGGLVARSYIESNYYNNDIENFIELGTPNAGSVEDYGIWEAGESISNKRTDKLFVNLFNIEAYENGHLSLKDYIHSYVQSVQQLLPISNYIVGRSYPTNYPRNIFLESLNQASKVSLISSRVKLSVIGSNSWSTLSGIGLSNPTNHGNWLDGEVTSKSYSGGDGTVPFSSLQSIGPANLILTQDHGGLASNPSDRIPSILMGDAITADYKADNNIEKYLLIYVKSPVRLSIVDPLGKVVNDDHNDVKGAFYTGSDEQIQFITIPNPLEGKYSIQLVGKDSGGYTVGVATIDEPDQPDKTVEMTGTTKVNQVSMGEYDTVGNILSIKYPIFDSTSNVAINGNAVLSSTPYTRESIKNGLVPIIGTDYTDLMPVLASSLPKAAPKSDSLPLATVEMQHAFEGPILIAGAMISVMIGLLWLALKKNRQY